MTRPFITLGDKTSHGGTVLQADVTFVVHGKPVALVGHMVVCPRCKGTFPITTGTEDMFSMGAPAARHGDQTACGATLIASQGFTTWSPESQGGRSAPLEEATTAASPGPVSPSTPTLCLECLATAAARGDSLVPRA